MKKLIPLFLLLSIFLVASASAYMPGTHTYMNDKAMIIAPNSEVGQKVQNYYEDYIACDVLTDISVFYYFTEGFNRIGTKYKQTHTQNLCQRMVQNAENDRQLACAYGVCAHHVQDGVSHNQYVPTVVERTKLVNGLVHIFAEEKVNDELIKSEGIELNTRIRQAIANVAPVHKEFFRANLVSEGSDFPFDSMYDAFVSEVTSEDKYSVGFRAFTAVPFSIHLTLISIFLLSTLILAFLIRRKTKTKLNYIAMFLLFLFIIMPIILAYVLFYTGKLWVFFQWASYPISSLMPTSGWESYSNMAIQETANMMNGGYQYVIANTPDPAGEIALMNAGRVGAGLRTVVNVIVGILFVLFIYLNFRRKK